MKDALPIRSDLAETLRKRDEEIYSQPPPPMLNFMDSLEYGLLYLNNTSAVPFRDSKVQQNVFNLNTFDGAWIDSTDRVGPLEDSNLISYLKPFECQVPVDLFNKLNIKTITFSPDTISPRLHKYRLLNAEERRYIPASKRFVIEHRCADINLQTDVWRTLGTWFYSSKMKVQGEGFEYDVNNTIPISPDPRYVLTDEYLNEYVQSEQHIVDIRGFNLALNLNLTAYYEWFVYIRETEKSIGVKIPILPESSKDVFVLRDLPEGKIRRKAICNFVQKHYRQTKSTYNDETRESMVRQHLRGESKFNWRGLQVHIVPAQYDLNRIKTSKKFVKI